MKNKKIISLISLFFLSSITASCGSKLNDNFASLQINNQNQNVNSLYFQRNDAKDFLDRTVKAYSEIKDFTAKVVIMDSKTGEPDDVDYGESNFFFKKDRNERVEVTKSSDSQKNGSILVYHGGSKVDVLLAKPIPILGRKFKLSVSDKRLATSRKLPFDQLDITAMLERVSKDGVQTSYLGEANINGKKVFQIEAIGSFRGLDSEVTREVISIDSESFLPVQDEVFVKDKTVLKINVLNLKLNVGLADNVFELSNIRYARR